MTQDPSDGPSADSTAATPSAPSAPPADDPTAGEPPAQSWRSPTDEDGGSADATTRVIDISAAAAPTAVWAGAPAPDAGATGVDPPATRVSSGAWPAPDAGATGVDPPATRVSPGAWPAPDAGAQPPYPGAYPAQGTPAGTTYGQQAEAAAYAGLGGTQIPGGAAAPGAHGQAGAPPYDHGTPAYANPGYGHPGYGHPGYGAPGYGAPAWGYGAPVHTPPTNTLAIIAFVAAFVIPPAAIILGVIARRQIRTSGEQGDGLALAGIIVGAVVTGCFVLLIIVTLLPLLFLL